MCSGISYSSHASTRLEDIRSAASCMHVFFVAVVSAVIQITVQGGNTSYDVIEKNFKTATGKDLAKRRVLQ